MTYYKGKGEHSVNELEKIIEEQILELRNTRLNSQKVEDDLTSVIEPVIRYLRKNNKPYPKVMLVSDYEDFTRSYPRVVHKEAGGKFAAWFGAETLDEAEDEIISMIWDYAKDI